MKKNGFTLVELLAILIILSLIAIITIPVVFNMIDSSKKGTVKDSAYGYISSIQKMYYSNQLDDSFFELGDRYYTVSELKDLGINFNGQEPIGDSWVLFSNNDVVKGCLQFDDYRVGIENGEVTKVLKGQCEAKFKFNGKYVGASEGDTHKGIVYLDPTNLSNACDETNYVSTLGTNEGCMKFYIFDENSDGTVDMILDHNISNSKEWTAYSQNQNYVNYYGPREALGYLWQDTHNWEWIDDLDSDSNYTVSLRYGDELYTYTIDYTKKLYGVDTYQYDLDNPYPYKARFITAEEVASIINLSIDFNNSNASEYSFGSLSSADYLHQTEEEKSRQRSYSWLFENLSDCTDYGCEVQNDVEIDEGYWTGTASSIGNRCNVWAVSNEGKFISLDCINLNYGGIRPVITIPKYVLGID